MNYLNRKNISLHMKLLLVFVVVFVLPTIILSLVFEKSYSARVRQENIDSVIRRSDGLAENIAGEINSIISYSNALYLNDDIANIFGKIGDKQRLTNEEVRRLDSSCSLYGPLLGDLYISLAFLDDQGEVVYSPHSTYYFNTDEMQAYIKKRLEEPYLPNMKWFSDCDVYPESITNGKPESFYSLRLIWDSTSKMCTGAVIFRISITEILRQYMLQVMDYQSVYIIDEAGNKISFIDNLKLDYDPFVVFSSSVEKYSATSEREYQGKKILITVHTLEHSYWRIVSFTGIDQQTAFYSTISRSYYLSLIGCLILMTILSYIFATALTRPIRYLTEQVKEVGKGNWATRVKVSSNDEIGELSNHFNRMVENIESLMGQILREQDQKRKADIIALQFQVNPHFIYNTLTVIRYMVSAGMNDKADQAILALNRMLRNILSSTDSLVTVNLEVAQLNDYLQIQNMSFGQPIDVSVLIEEEIGNYLIIKMILQPIVENAVLHGLKPIEGDKKLTISGYRTGTDIEFCIQDNGVGFDVSKVDISKEKEQTGAHIGLANVNQRIKLYYGEAYGLRVESAMNTGAKVYIKLPQIVSHAEDNK